VLLTVAGEPVTDADQALELLGASKEAIPVTVRRQSRERTVSVDGAVLNARQDVQLKTGEQRIVIKIRDRDDAAPKPPPTP
jgi:DNA-binding PucR family transcriptional regulator